MDKIVAGPACKGALDLDAPVEQNLKAIAACYDRPLEALVIIVLDRPRHEDLINRIRATGARIRLIGDGDLSAGIAAAGARPRRRAGVGSLGAPHRVLTPPPLRRPRADPVW